MGSGSLLYLVFLSSKGWYGQNHQTGSVFALQTKQTLLFLFCFVSGLILSTSSACEWFVTSSARLAPAEMQSQRTPGRKRGRPPLHSTPVKMAVHNLYSASAGSLPAVKIPKKRGRKPGYKVWLATSPPFSTVLSGWGMGVWAELHQGMWGKMGSWVKAGSIPLCQWTCKGRGPVVVLHHACCCRHVRFHKWTKHITLDWGSCKARPF